MRKYEDVRIEPAEGGYVLRYTECYKQKSACSCSDNICKNWGCEKIFTDVAKALAEMDRLYKAKMDDAGNEIVESYEEPQDHS